MCGAVGNYRWSGEREKGSRMRDELRGVGAPARPWNVNKKEVVTEKNWKPSEKYEGR